MGEIMNDFIFIAVSLLAGICGSCLPPIPRWYWWEMGWYVEPPPDPDGPKPNERSGPVPQPWLLITGLIAGIGGALAWIALGDEFAAEGALAPPVVLGLLGGAAAAWAVTAARSFSRPSRRS
jgi:hypothetical protein